jgi:hypothetical protein
MKTKILVEANSALPYTCFAYFQHAFKRTIVQGGSERRKPGTPLILKLRRGEFLGIRSVVATFSQRHHSDCNVTQLAKSIAQKCARCELNNKKFTSQAKELHPIIIPSTAEYLFGFTCIDCVTMPTTTDAGKTARKPVYI